MSDDDKGCAGFIGTPNPHEIAERLAEEFHRDMKSCKIFKGEGHAQVTGHFKKRMSKQEYIERTLKAMKE